MKKKRRKEKKQKKEKSFWKVNVEQEVNYFEWQNENFLKSKKKKNTKKKLGVIVWHNAMSGRVET